MNGCRFGQCGVSDGLYKTINHSKRAMRELLSRGGPDWHFWLIVSACSLLFSPKPSLCCTVHSVEKEVKCGSMSQAELPPGIWSDTRQWLRFSLKFCMCVCC